jgi:hypothetical protein
MVAGQSVERLVATVKTAFMPNTAASGKKWKTMQAAILADATGEIRAVFWDQPKDLRNLKGSVVTLVAADDYSIRANDKQNTKTGAIDREVNVGKSVKLDESTLPGAAVIGKFPDESPLGKPLGETVRITEVPPAPMPAGKPYYEDSKRESIERQKALELAVDYAIRVSSEAPTVDGVVSMAATFYKFLSGDSTKVI